MLGIKTYKQGTSVRLTSVFYDWEGNPIDPSNVILKIYDGRYTKLEDLPLTVNVNTGVGEYQYDYTFLTEGEFVYEWYADINGSPSLERERIRVIFV